MSEGRQHCSATVVITTRNRCHELPAAISSASRQSVQPEVLVIDDGSTDKTADMVRTDFPEVRLERSANSLGYIVQRNRAARLASGEILFSLDDDAKFSTSGIVEQTIKEFDPPRIGAVAIPFINIRISPEVLQQAPQPVGTYITDAYVGTAHAVRRDVFLKIGGYREELVHQGEERDFCLRMLALGYVVKLGSADPIHHFDSARRSFKRMDFYGRRNDILFAVHNVPMPHLPIHLIGTTLNGLSFALRCGRAADQIHGIGAGYLEGLRRWGERQPVSAVIYRLQRLLRKAGPCPLERIENKLPACVLSP